MELLQYGWEIIVNIIEALLFFYLLFQNNSCSPKSKRILPVAFLLRVTFISIINLKHFSAPVSVIFLLLYDILFVCTCFYGNFSRKLILGSSYTLIAIAADRCTYIIASVITSYNLSELTILGPIRFQLTLTYLLICSVFIFCLSRYNGKNDLFLSPLIQFLMFAFILFAIIISEQLLGITIDISNHTIPKHAILLLSISNLFILLSIFSFIFLIERLGYLAKCNLEFMQMQEQEKAEQQNHQLTEEYIKTLRYWKHDYQNHLSVIHKLNQKKDYVKLNDYVNQLTKEANEVIPLVSTGNSILDAIISAKLLLARKYNISFTYQIYLPQKELPLSDIQFASLLSNLLDNSIEACTHLNNNTLAFISLEIKPHHQMFYLKIENSSNGTYLYDKNGNLKSSKTSIEHGLGLKRICHLVTKGDGFIQFEPLDTTFTTTILLPLNSTYHSERTDQ